MDRKLVQQLIGNYDFQVIRLAPKTKEPFEKEWQKRTETVPPSEFRDDDNVGLILGHATSIIDVDLDNPVALAVADIFLPPTNMSFGRRSEPRAHRLYKVAGGGETHQYSETSRGMIIELRADGAQTMIPPSVHPCGEQLYFEPNLAAEPITEADYAMLHRTVTQIAMATLLKAYWNVGVRHFLALAVAGVLRRAGWSKGEIAEYIHKLCGIFADEELDDRLRCVDDTFADGRPVNGTRRLADLIGRAEADTIHRWLKIERSQPPSGGTKCWKDATDRDCAESFSHAHGDDLFYDSVHKTWFLRERGTFRAKCEITVQRLIREYGEQLRQSGEFGDTSKFQSSRGMKAILDVSKTFLERNCEEFDLDPHLLGCENGILNLETNELLQILR